MNLDAEEMNQYELYMEQEQEKENDLERDENAPVVLEEGAEEKSQGTERQDAANVLAEKLGDSQPERAWAPYVERSKLPQYIVTSEALVASERAYLSADGHKPKKRSSYQQKGGRR